MRILLATDGSEHSRPVLAALLERPWPKDTKVRVISVAESPLSLGVYAGMGTNYDEWGEASTKHAQDVVNSTVDRIRAHGMAAEGLIRHGDARTEIVEEAVHWRADVVLLGSHGRTGVTRWLVGSVAEHVARHAPCSVEIVRTRLAA
jgi:nucleotide-binding universal stress UspA family protein